jgi:hypothetical protein
MAKIINIHEDTQSVEEDQAEFDIAIAKMPREKISEMDRKILEEALEKIINDEE